MATEEPWTPVEYVVNGLKVPYYRCLSIFELSAYRLFIFCLPQTQLVFAISPLLVLGYVLLSAFESEEAENRKRNKKSDFNLEGHGE